MSIKTVFYVAGLFLTLILCASAQQGPLTFRADVGGHFWWYAGSKIIMPQKTFYIDIYANYDPSGLSVPRRNWSSPFVFTGTSYWNDSSLTAVWGDTSLFPQPTFRSFWNVFQRTYAESWNNTLPDLFNFTGVADEFGGFPSGLGEILILRLSASLFLGERCRGMVGYFCIRQGDAENDIYDWLFDDPQPTFTETCWSVETPPCMWPLMKNCPSRLVAPADQESTLDFDFESECCDVAYIKILSGPGTIDSITGIWRYTPPIDVCYDTLILKVVPYDDCSCPTDICTVNIFTRALCGDANYDSYVNIRDVTAAINCLYKIPGCSPTIGMDADGNESVNIQDITYEINYLYKNGPAPICPPCS